MTLEPGTKLRLLRDLDYPCADEGVVLTVGHEVKAASWAPTLVACTGTGIAINLPLDIVERGWAEVVE